MKHFFVTDRGRVRPHNEDSVGVFENDYEQLLTVVADGMGGHKAGDVASEMVITYFKDAWASSERIQSQEEAESWLTHHIQQANHTVYDYSRTNPECLGMGTTTIAVISFSDTFVIAHIGDSRCYLYQADALHQITDDHSLVNELVRSGQITKADAEIHPQKNVLTQALGTDSSITPDVYSKEWSNKDRILICTDGLTNKIDDDHLKQYLSLEQSLETIANQLVEEANVNGGEDNITVAILENDDLKAGESTC
ncbi:protein phosphatase [Pelagirhabdus alkalitolerans]|uniref:protein-serine/threonine phosphatase n=1 Tax=Pelagirhabdus alkalitolerans TaxID=1612202 RepID=A0A1G6H1E5_9BACI|nr:Stp1/IreP family PP2C-type Ser/Thr phosphatase [Pelagirhabdus alkalitolerans]SDB88092.1 protein phosphatase [Pelagirhabdus alkalitolerans]